MHYVKDSYDIAHKRFSELGVDTETAIQTMTHLPVSIQCWQGDDVGGFEKRNPSSLTGGIQATGNYPGKARTADELRQDIEIAINYIPGPKRINLHASYLECNETIERNEIASEHFENWVLWAKHNHLSLDFNPTYFSHPLSQLGTLTNPDENIRQFWIDHGIACRKISAYFGKELNSPSIMNIWIPDGMKDLPADRFAPRQRLIHSLDQILHEKIDENYHIDAVESKLFGIGIESYTAGSNEFYLGYAITRKTALCLDSGHFHPTELISDKISAVTPYVHHLLLHISRPVRWDSDHVVLLDDETQAIANEIVREKLFNRVHIGLDFFDASINRIAAWIIGARNVKKALLRALLEPTDQLRTVENKMDFTSSLALMEEQKSLPWSAVWDEYCNRNNASIGQNWLKEIRNYEASTLLKR
ncbi:L-rhamnose isomerase [Commensalibacter sp. Nvir]|uniref:L-rhamnose isomerase n=1 Tax=Commensalibacter sp. Nvir TaxID=3069817 RepID=UPI002D251203|nr:L-rhamnose isomerase [Commensalibacter sp. Nvir]